MAGRHDFTVFVIRVAGLPSRKTGRGICTGIFFHAAGECDLGLVRTDPHTAGIVESRMHQQFPLRAAYLIDLAEEVVAWSEFRFVATLRHVFRFEHVDIKRLGMHGIFLFGVEEIDGYLAVDFDGLFLLVVKNHPARESANGFAVPAQCRRLPEVGDRSRYFRIIVVDVRYLRYDVLGHFKAAATGCCGDRADHCTDEQQDGW